jgi:hypothetical protein
MSQQINITLKAYDEASRTVAEASNNIKNEMAKVEEANKRVIASQKETATSTRDLITGFSGAATAGFSLYNAYDRVADMQINVDRANLQVKTSANSVEDAQRRVSSTSETLTKAQKATYEATLTYGSGSRQATEALQREEAATVNSEAAKADLELAQERLTVAQDRAEQVQDNMNEAMIQSALQVIPTTITMVDSLSKAWKNFPDMSKTLSGVAAKVGEVGISAKTAAIGVAAFMGGFLIADTVLNAIPEDMRAIAGALTATIAAIVAATVAWMAFHGTMTVGVAVPIILAAVGVGIAGIKAAVGMAEGGIVRKPTFALLGEAGPEAVIPLKNLGVNVETSSEVQNITVNPVINIGNISSDVDLHRVTESVSRGIYEALRRRI